MWIVAKIKVEELNIFKKQLKEKMGDEIKFYEPKIIFSKKNMNVIKNILGNYIFCFHEKFRDYKYLNKLQYTKGLKYFLKYYKNSQKDIFKFINFCRENEDNDGFLKTNFFKKILKKKGKFINGPLANIVFEILENNKNNLIINIERKKIKIRKGFKFFYLPA